MGQNYIHTRLHKQLPDLIALFKTTIDGRTVYTENKVFATTDSGSEYLLVTYYLTNWSNHFVSKTTASVLGR